MKVSITLSPDVLGTLIADIRDTQRHGQTSTRLGARALQGRNAGLVNDLPRILRGIICSHSELRFL